MKALAATAVLAALLLAGGTVAWVRTDAFLDREEAQHALRALDVHDALGRLREDPAGPFRLQREDVKAYYGWPYYLAVAAAWRTFGLEPDHGVLLNVALALAFLAVTWALGLRLGGPEAGAGAALFLAVSPGLAVWTRLLGPGPCVALLVASSGLLLVEGERRRSVILSLLAGLVACLCLVVKLTNGLYLAPLLVLAPRFRRGWIAFAAGASPALAWWAFHGDVLVAWSGLLHGVFRSTPAGETLGDSLRHAVLGLLPLQAAWLLAAIPMLWRGDRRALAALLVWIGIPLVGLPVLARFLVTPQHVLPLLAPAALIAGLALARLPSRPRAVLASLLLASGALHLWTISFGQEPAALRYAVSWPPRTVGASYAGFARAQPSARRLDDVRAFLDTLAPAAASRCGCLPYPPYPVPGDRHHPVALLDSSDVGPENLEAWTRFRSAPPSWQFGSVPYGLSCAAFRVALDCASVVLTSPPAPEYVSPDRARTRAEGRPLVAAWGEVRSGAAGLQVRIPSTAGLCQTSPPESVAYVQALVGGCGPDFYRLHLEALPGASPAAVDAAAARARDLEAGADPMALVFGELYLARAVAGR